MTAKKQTEVTRQRGFQLHDTAGKPFHDADGKLIFELVDGIDDPAPQDPQDGSGNRWVKVWDNKRTTESTIEPWSDPAAPDAAPPAADATAQ